jgi:hypothetical protein
MNRADLLEDIQSRGRDILKFIGNHIHRLGKTAQRRVILIGGGGDLMGHVTGRRIGAGLKNMRL